MGSVVSGHCTFCFKHDGDPSPWCPDNPGHGCTYGMHHEFPVTEEVAKPKQVAKPSKKLCTKCGLHPQNPKAATNGCEHEYPG